MGEHLAPECLWILDGGGGGGGGLKPFEPLKVKEH